MRGYRGSAPVRNIIDSRGTFNAVQRVAKVVGCKLTEREGCVQPYTDLSTKEVVVPRLSPYMTPAELKKWLGEVYHEVGHHAPELGDVNGYMQEHKLGWNSLVGQLMNVGEDFRNEMNRRGMAVGRDEALSWCQSVYCARGAEGLKEHGLPKNKDKLLTCQALALTYDWRTRYQPDLALPSANFSSIVEWDCYSHLQPRLDELVTIADVHQWALDFIDDSPDHDREAEEQKAEKAFEQSQSEEGEEEGEKGEGKSSDKSESSDEEGEGEDTEVSYEELMGMKHGGERKLGGEKAKIIYDHARRDDYKPWPEMLVEKARDLRPGATSGYGAQIPAIEKMYKSGRILASTARRLFQSRLQTRNSRNHLTGRLDKRDLYRIPSGSKDVFKRKEKAPDPKGTDVFLLSDGSGSMAGEKFQATAAAVALLNDACTPLGVSIKIATFTEMSPMCRHYIVKEYGEKRSAEQIFDDYNRVYPTLAQNADGESIMWAARDLAMRSAPRKLLIVLSDGCPSSDNEGDCFSYTKDVINHISKWPSFELYGIGIMDSTVEKLYPEYVVLDEVSKLEDCLLNLIKTKIFKEI
jgi:hypothetical protein